jgi:hypothetical protein
MATNIRLSSELKNWITHNLQRGCQPADLVTSMVSQRFEPQIAHALISDLCTAT